jgi:hypothetical protein
MREVLERLSSCVVIESELRVKIFTPASMCDKWPDRKDLIRFRGRLVRVDDYGLQSRKVVTTAGVNFLVAVWTGVGTLGNMKFHGIGRGSGAESSGDTLLGTELTTEYNPDNTRATGSTVVGASNNIIKSVGTNTLDGNPASAIQEHGLFSSSASGATTLWDRSLIGPFTMSSGQSIQTEYDGTFAAGG